MIYIVRHGQTNYNLEGKITGRTDIPLNETGKKEAELLRDKFNNMNFDYVFTSPLVRTIETAKIITNNEIMIDERLIERSNGLIEGKKFDELGDFDFESDDYELEPILSVQERVDSFFNEIKEKYPDKNILVVTHGGVIIRIRYYFEGNPKSDYTEYLIKNCEILKYPN